MQESSSEFENKSDEAHACRILITCRKPKDDGKMDVEMTYEGDPTLASYLLERAQTYLHQDDEMDFC
ncbi:MAG: hypothetical protein S4CHLAM45_08600 [Chlamydiales bacterium]|nr:hypothetical protein [Chlamydiales bacterium]MCH9620390.1 hypothetical protein [Chlamydiales bacterium]MCH9622964.1 hypothetical protein [Chlamydiales bacterium]